MFFFEKSTFFLKHKKEGASKVSVILPYLAYARQDKEKKGESLAAACVGALMRSSYISEIITIDLHSHKAESLFSIPIYDLSPAKLFAKEIKKLKLKNPTFVAPDEGAMERTRKVIEEYGGEVEIAFMKKERTPGGISSILYGQVSKNVVVIDDILDTGGTLVECSRVLKSAGAKNIYIFVTHGQFSGSSWKQLFNLNVKKIYCTDSIPTVYSLNLKEIEVISVGPLLIEYSHHLKKIRKEIKRVYREAKKVEIAEPEEPLL